MNASAHVDFRQAVIKGEALIPIIWKECTPRTGEELHRIGTQVAAALAVRRPAWQAAELVADALEDGAGLAQLTKLSELGARFGKASPRDLGLAALGGITVGTLTRLAEVESLEDIDPHKVFDDMVEPVARMAIRRYTAACRRELGALDAALSELG
jgi:hypothetical protein